MKHIINHGLILQRGDCEDGKESNPDMAAQ